MNAYDGLGFAHLAAGRHDEAARAFGHAFERYPDHARSRLGLAAARRAAGRAADAEQEFAARAARRDPAQARRRATEARLGEAFEHALFERRDQAVTALQGLLADADAPFAGWTIPIEPLFRAFRGSPAFSHVLTTLADRAR